MDKVDDSLQKILKGLDDRVSMIEKTLNFMHKNNVRMDALRDARIKTLTNAVNDLRSELAAVRSGYQG